jgi:hypothetical protein
MCKTWDRIHMWIGIVLMPFQVRGIFNMEIRIQNPDRHQNDADPQHWV